MLNLFKLLCKIDLRNRLLKVVKIRISERKDGFLFRWDLNYKCNYTSVCITCKFFLATIKHCINKYNVNDYGVKPERIFAKDEKELSLYEPYNFSCDNHEFIPNIELLLINPYKNHKWDEIEVLRKQFENEIDLTLNYKSRCKTYQVMIDNIEINSIVFKKTYFKMNGFLWNSDNNPKDKHHLNLHYIVAERKQSEFKDKPSRIERIEVFKNGNRKDITYAEFTYFVNLGNFDSLFNTDKKTVLDLRIKLFELIPEIKYIYKNKKRVEKNPAEISDRDWISVSSIEYQDKDVLFDEKTKILFNIDGLKYSEVLSKHYKKHNWHFSGLSEFEYLRMIRKTKEKIDNGTWNS